MSTANGTPAVAPAVEAERATIGAMLRSNDVIPDVALLVQESDFRTAAHQFVFRVILGLSENGEPVDLVTVADALKRHGHIEDVNYPYLGELIDAAPSPANATWYAQRVRESSMLYRLYNAAAEIGHDAAHPASPVSDILTTAERKVFAILERSVTGSTVTIQQAMAEEADRLDMQVTKGKKGGLPTGLSEFDSLTAGLHGGELCIIAARPSIGKTSLGLRLATHAVLEEGAAVYFVSLEQSRTELAGRLFCAEGNLDSWRYRRCVLHKEERARVGATKESFAVAKLHIDDNSSQNMLRIAANTRRLKRRDNLGLVIIDYLQLIEPENRRDLRQEQVAGISRRLKQLAREVGIPVVAMAQLNRGSEEHGRPRLSDLRESGAIEQDADTVVLLYRPDPAQESTVRAYVAKQRNGPTGEVELYFDKARMRFQNPSEF
jgi:replicative DNA helicase